LRINTAPRQKPGRFYLGRVFKKDARAGEVLHCSAMLIAVSLFEHHPGTREALVEVFRHHPGCARPGSNQRWKLLA